ncbi:cell division protein ZipA [Cellvibrio sp. pealriver]|uniref:cell division protein ZipA n=1 Tax=Cellvibrio sp. pealriver TaxID=1622269 RepID=UPI00066FFD38|nr:cell division protein ZipA [Cellvibrio sp. pealriver]
MKDLVIIISTLLILLILADGIRRKRNERNGNIKVSRSLKKNIKQSSDYDDVEDEAPSYTSELPNGGARVVGKRDVSAPIPSIEKKAQAKSYLEKHQSREQDAISPRVQREPQQTSLNLGQAVPMLMESVDDNKNRSLPLEDRIEPSFSANRESDLDEDYDDREAGSQNRYETEDYDAEEYREDYDSNSEYEQDDEIGDDDLDDTEALNPEDNDGYEDDGYDEDEYDDEEYSEDQEYGNASGNSSQQQFAEKQPSEPEEVLIINVMAHKGEMFNGGELLDVILKCGMRYGSMDIFHRHSDTKGEGALLFSMANMVKPGTFDLDAMDDFETPGVSLFMTLPINADSMQSFDLMADTARAIAEALNGELKDEQRSVMTRQTLEHCRQRIRDFERMRLFRRPPR